MTTLVQKNIISMTQ